MYPLNHIKIHNKKKIITSSNPLSRHCVKNVHSCSLSTALHIRIDLFVLCAHVLGLHSSMYAWLNFRPSLNPTASQQDQQIRADLWPRPNSPLTPADSPNLRQMALTGSFVRPPIRKQPTSGAELPNIKAIITGFISCWTYWDQQWRHHYNSHVASLTVQVWCRTIARLGSFQTTVKKNLSSVICVFLSA